MASTARVGIEIDIRGWKEAREQMEMLEAQMKRLSGFKVRLQISARLKDLQSNLVALRSEIAKLKADQAGVAKGTAEWDRIAERLARARMEAQQTTAEMQRLKSAMSSVRPLGQVFRGISTSMAHVGSAMQSAGNAISRLMTPFRMLTSGLMLSGAFKAIHTVTEGLSSGFSRYDTMKKYPKIMSAFGYSAKEAQASIDKLDKSVRGLPTGLDEMVNMAQRFTATTGDIEKGTDLAIASNNAFLASMSTDTQRYQGMMQLQDVLGGKDMNAREWNSLVSSMTPAVVKMGESLGYTKDNMDEFIQKIRDGKMANEDFIDTLIKVGTENGEVAKMANESKDTWQAFTLNVKNAFSRMSAGILTSLDEIVKIATHGDFDSLNMLLADFVGPGIDKMAESIKKWIKAHPDTIIDFFNDMKKIDWKGFGKGIVEGIGTILKAIQKMAQWLDGKSLKGAGKGMVYLNVIGQGLLIFGGLIKGLRGVFGGIGALGTGIAGSLKALGIIGGAVSFAGIAKLVKGMGKVGKASKVAGGVANVSKFGSLFKAFIPALEVIAGIGAITTSISAIAMIDTKLLSMAMTNVKTITEDMGAVLNNIKGLRTEGFDVGGLRTAVNDIFAIYDIIYGETTGYQATGKTFKQNRENGFADFDKGFLSDLSESMGSMVEIFASMNTMQYSLKGMKGFKKFDEGITEGISNFASSLGGIYTSFSTAFEDNIDAEQAEGFSNIVESTKTMFGNLNTIAKLIPKLTNSMLSATGTQMGWGSPLERLKKMLIGDSQVSGGLIDKSRGSTGFFGTLKEIMSSFESDLGSFDTETLSTQASQISSAIQSIKQIGNKLASIGSEGGFGANTEGMSAGINAIKTMISQLGTVLNTDTLGSISMQIGTFQTSVENLFNTLNGDLNGVKVTVNIDGEVEGDDDLISDINKAKEAIKSAVKNIPSDIYKYVTIHINGSVENNLGSLNIPEDYPHTGGYIAGAGKLLYRKSGGGIPVFKPKGTDTVPAMLTPGEYVQSKKAVDYFGVRFMQKINNLDVRGAMRELSARAGSMASFNRGSSITNNITNNNNQQLVQNINTNNPNFAFKRSNRFITALT